MSNLKKAVFWIVVSLQIWFVIALIALCAFSRPEVDEAWRNWMRVKTPLTQEQKEAEIKAGKLSKIKNVFVVVGVFALADFLIFYQRPKANVAKTTAA